MEVENARKLVRSDQDRLRVLAQTPKDREKLEIFAPLSYRRGHDHDSFHRRFYTRFLSPRLPGTSPNTFLSENNALASVGSSAQFAELPRCATLGVSSQEFTCAAIAPPTSSPHE
jgi:hypothetical protein